MLSMRSHTLLLECGLARMHFAAALACLPQHRHAQLLLHRAAVYANLGACLSSTAPDDARCDFFKAIAIVRAVLGDSHAYVTQLTVALAAVGGQ